MSSKKIFKLLISLILVVFILNIYSICYAANEKITNDFELDASFSDDNEVTYNCHKEDNQNVSLSIKAKDYNLPSNLYDYKDEIRLRISYTEGDNKVYDCKVINHETGELIQDLSEENINKLFNIEYGKNIIEKSWSDKIKLSELKENEVYKYTASSTIQFPKIENDINKNCIIYIKEHFKTNYEKKINLYKKISGYSLSTSDNEYNSGDSFYIMYKSIGNSELLDLIKKDEIIYLSKYKDGDKLEYNLENYIYNDTEKNITINIKDKTFGVEHTDSVTIPKGEIYEFDSMIDSAIISYSNNNNNNNNTNAQSNQQTENNKDNSIVKSSILPKTGISNIIILIIILSFIVIMVITLKLKKFKNIK